MSKFQSKCSRSSSTTLTVINKILDSIFAKLDLQFHIECTVLGKVRWHDFGNTASSYRNVNLAHNKWLWWHNFYQSQLKELQFIFNCVGSINVYSYNCIIIALPLIRILGQVLLVQLKLSELLEKSLSIPWIVK